MLKKELEKLVGIEITDFDFEIIDKVYMYYPSEKPVSKNFIADMYKTLGMRVFHDLYSRARKMCELESQIRVLEFQKRDL